MGLFKRFKRAATRSSVSDATELFDFPPPQEYPDEQDMGRVADMAGWGRDRDDAMRGAERLVTGEYERSDEDLLEFDRGDVVGDDESILWGDY